MSGVVGLRALLKFVIAGLIVLSLAAGVVIWARDWRLWQIQADPMASWRPSQAHTETRYESGVPLIPVAAQNETASLDRSLRFVTADDAALAEKEANGAAVTAGWTASDPSGSYSKQLAHGILARLHIDRVDSRLWLTLVG